MRVHPHTAHQPRIAEPVDSEDEARLDASDDADSGAIDVGAGLDVGADAGANADTNGIERLFEMTSDLLAAISLDGRFTLLNPAWADALGWSIEELVAQPMQARVHPDDLEQTLALTLAGRNRSAQLVNFTNRYRHKDGSWRWLLWSARCDGKVWYAAARDVTDRMWLERQALHDPLTKLPNRLLLMDRADQALARLHRSQGAIALLFIDLDGLKAINDSLGHAVGDLLLVSVAERLAQTLRDSDTVARLGGDEFVILAEDLSSDEEALAVAERVVQGLEEPFEVGSIEVGMFASVGVSISRNAEADPEDLLREADVAMYRAKRAGGHRLELFDEDLHREPIGDPNSVSDRSAKSEEEASPSRSIRSHAPWHPIARLKHRRR
jgi:diguanylate cyclase (GGDEF)-like protein/PAS domain S-box-containing protein